MQKYFKDFENRVLQNLWNLFLCFFALYLQNISVIFIAFALKKCKKSINRSAAMGQKASFLPNLKVVTLKFGVKVYPCGPPRWCTSVPDYVQGQNIKYVDSSGKIWIFTIGIFRLVPLSKHIFRRKDWIYSQHMQKTSSKSIYLTNWISC